MEYTGKIFLKTLVREGNYHGWSSGGEIKVKADSLDEALKKIEQEGLKKFPGSFIHIDSVSDFVKREVYRTGWDELGPLVAVSLESVKKEIEELKESRYASTSNSCCPYCGSSDLGDCCIDSVIKG